MSRLRSTPELDEHDRKNKISDPVKLPPEHEGLDLASLAKLYPPPVIEDTIYEAAAVVVLRS